MVIFIGATLAGLLGAVTVHWIKETTRLKEDTALGLVLASVAKELRAAEDLTSANDVLTLTMCVNYGGRAELADTARSIAREVAAGRLDADCATPCEALSGRCSACCGFMDSLLASVMASMSFGSMRVNNGV